MSLIGLVAGMYFVVQALFYCFSLSINSFIDSLLNQICVYGLYSRATLQYATKTFESNNAAIKYCVSAYNCSKYVKQCYRESEDKVSADCGEFICLRSKGIHQYLPGSAMSSTPCIVFLTFEGRGLFEKSSSLSYCPIPRFTGVGEVICRPSAVLCSSTHSPIPITLLGTCSSYHLSNEKRGRTCTIPGETLPFS